MKKITPNPEDKELAREIMVLARVLCFEQDGLFSDHGLRTILGQSRIVSMDACLELATTLVLKREQQDN